MVGRSLCTPAARVQFPGWEARIIRCKNVALYIRDCEYLCLSDETPKAVALVRLVLLWFKAGAPRTEHYQLVRTLSADAVVTVL